MLSRGTRVKWLDRGQLRHGEITRVLTAGRHRLAGESAEWRATTDAPIYLIETESGTRKLVPHVFVERV